MKNRFPDILPYDDSRIELPSTKDDYINASLVKVRLTNDCNGNLSVLFQAVIGQSINCCLLQQLIYLVVRRPSPSDYN